MHAPHVSRSILMAILVLAGAASASAIEAPPAADDYNQNEFAPRPTPSWVQMIDQGTKDPRLAGLTTPAGLRVEIVAEQPATVNPVGMTFDDQGTPWVLEWRFAPEAKHTTYEVRYRDGNTAQVNRIQKSVRDELKTLHDADGDGHYEQATVVMNDLEIPSSILLHDGWVYLSSLGHVIRRRPAGDGKWKEEEIVRGLCGFHHHQASGMTMSPDGWLFITSGDDDNRGEGSDGSRATVLRTGAVLRCRPDGSQLHEFARGFRNPYRDVSFDHMYNLFHVDNDQEDGSKFQGVRLMHVVDGADYGWRLAPGTICCRTDFELGAAFGERPGTLPAMLKTGRGAPAGLLIYQGTSFPEFFRGLLIYPDVYRKLVRAYRVERRGSTFAVIEQFELMKTEDGLFRPCQAVMGPDGAIYIVDWRTDSGGAGRLWGDGEHGRIYRLTWEGTSESPAIAPGKMDAWASIHGAKDDELYQLLDSPDFELRKRALEELMQRGARQRDKLVTMARDTARPAHARAAAAAGAARLYDASVQLGLIGLLSDQNLELRRLAAELLGRNTTREDIHVPRLTSLTATLNDPHPAVRRAAAVAVGQIASQLEQGHAARHVAAGALWSALANAPDDDPYLRDGILHGLELLGQDGINLMVQGALGRDFDLREMSIAALEAMRTAPAAAALDRLLTEPSLLNQDQQRRVLTTYRRIQVEPPIDGAVLASWLARQSDAAATLQLAGLESLASIHGAPTALALPIAIKLLKDPDEQLRIGVISLLGENHLVEAVPALVAAIADRRKSLAERQAIVTALSQLREQELPWGHKSAKGVELELDRLVALSGDPEHADLRADLVALVCAVDFSMGRPLAEAMLASGDTAAGRSAIAMLGADPAQAKQLAEQFVAGKLDRQLLPEISAALQKHIANEEEGEFPQLLQQVLRGGLLLSLDPAEVARVEALVQTTGDADHGREVYLNSQKSQCAICHKLEGVGGQVGPDLTRIWDTHTVTKIMESMIDPSKEIKEGYATFSATTKGGQVYTGLRVSADDQQVTLRDAQGKDIVIPRSDLDELVESKKSLMPEGVTAQLSFQEFIDLVAFLKNRGAQQALKGAK